MTRALLALGAAYLAAVGTDAAAVRLIPSAPVSRKNYRGLQIPTGVGISVVVGLVTGVLLVAVVHAVAPEAPSPFSASVSALPLLAATFGFALLGLFDDVVSAIRPGTERGFQAHIRALRQGALTSGGLKMIAGGAIAFAVVAPIAPSFGWALVDAAEVALMANLLNSLDVRPGRSGKAFLIGGVPLAILAGPLQAIVAAGLGAVVAFLPMDLSERAMLGDTGASAMGAFLGVAVVLVAGHPWIVGVILGILLLLTLVAEGPTLSAGIAAIPPLRVLDRFGRVPEDVPPRSRA